MAPPPEYDKEPKAPDKSDTNIASEELLNSLDNDQHPNLDLSKPSVVAALEVENNKHVEGLDDGQLRALLDEAITYKNPKDREGKSNLFKELLEEVEVQEEQAVEEAARTLSGCRGAGGAGAGRRGGARGRRALPHSSSMQDLVAAALAAEPAPRRHRHAPPSVSARAIHGGSLPSGVDTSSLLCEEPARGGYLATVRCVNPPPLAERRVSASDANAPAEMELLNRKNKPLFPMTYTARATLEIGSGSVSSGRAVTTTTASNQVALSRWRRGAGQRRTASPPGKMYDPKTSKIQKNQTRLLNALQPKKKSEDREVSEDKNYLDFSRSQSSSHNLRKVTIEKSECSKQWSENIDTWYRGLTSYTDLLIHNFKSNKDDNGNLTKISNVSNFYQAKNAENTSAYSMNPSGDIDHLDLNMNIDPHFKTQNESLSFIPNKHKEYSIANIDKPEAIDGSDSHLKNIYIPKHQGLVRPSLSSINPKNIRSMTIGNPKVAAYNLKKLQTPYIMLPQVYLNDPGKILEQSDKANDVENKSDMNKFKVASNESTKKPAIEIELIDFAKASSEIIDAQPKPNVDIELKDFSSVGLKTSDDPFLSYVNNQYKLLHSIEVGDSGREYIKINTNKKKCDKFIDVNIASRNNELNGIEAGIELFKDVGETQPEVSSSSLNQIALTKTNAIRTIHEDHNSEKEPIVLGQLSSDHISFTLPAYLLLQSNVADLSLALSPYSESNNNKMGPLVSKTETKSKKVEKKFQNVPSGNAKNAVSKIEAPRSNGFTVLLIENFFKNYVSGMAKGSPVKSPPDDKKVDSAISFSCITTPEVVSGCSTTASGGQSGAPADSKPRSVVATSFNGLPLARHNYGALAPPPDDTKKSLDENGNSVQGFSSPLSGSSQHKKPRRKKSSKNETVIDCQQIDGYQGDKDVNELLRFIESDAEPARAKLRKHRDDADDKHKKRCERRKDKDGAKSKRAASLEELSRTSLAELTAPAPRPPAPAPPPAPPAPPAPAPLELTDFQTVTKRRRARRRGEEAGRSAPARSADSTEDTDGASPPPAAPAASYAEIARARTAIPDLISSCTGAAALPAGRARRKPPDVLAARPAVVLRAPPDRADLHGVTFGFELNHQLLAPRRADALRYLPPAPPADPLPLQTLVEYVGAAWEDVVRCGGEVRYFGE